MPLYEYLCSSCHQRTEVIQNLSDAPRTECPKCGGEMKKLVSAPAIQFKGSGFYKTDYASSSSSGSTSSSSSTSSSATPAASPASSSTPSSETKSDSSKAD